MPSSPPASAPLAQPGPEAEYAAGGKGLSDVETRHDNDEAVSRHERDVLAGNLIGRLEAKRKAKEQMGPIS